MRLHDALPERVPVLTGLGAAHVAWFLGYFITAVVVWRGDRTAVIDTVSRLEPYQTVAWVFFGTHGVAVEVVPVDRGDDPAAFTATLVGGDGFTPLLYGLPVVLLAVAGAAVAVRAGSCGPVEGLVAGLVVVPGYLALAVAGGLVGSVAWSMSGGTANLEPVGVLVRAGLLYPAVCAGFAGLVIGTVRGGAPPSLHRSRRSEG